MLRSQLVLTTSQLPHTAQNPGKADSFRPHSWHTQILGSSSFKVLTSNFSERENSRFSRRVFMRPVSERRITTWA